MGTGTSARGVNLADLIVKAGCVYALDAERHTFRALAIRDGWIVAASEDSDGLDALADSRTHVVERPDLTVLPAFFDAHEHLLESGRNLARVQAQDAGSIGELIAMLRERAKHTPSGAWVQTTMGWSESNLAERRLPTAAELDQASMEHPILCPRGGHVCVANSLALKLARIDGSSPDPPGGSIGRDADGNPNGLLEGGLAQAIKALVPPPPVDESVDQLERACRTYAALGVGAIREALLIAADWEVYQRAWEQKRLALRCMPILLVDVARPQAERLAFIEGLGARSGFGDDWLRIWGLKLIADGGVAGAAMEEPFANNPSWKGHLNWDADEMAEVVELALTRSWKVAAHAVGDRTVRSVVDAYEQALSRHPETPPATLTVEHAFLADASLRERAVRLGIGITVQHSLLYVNGAEILASWGPDRTSAVMPVRSWLDAGAIVAAGTDTVSPFNPMLNIWGMVTRGTKDVGVQGSDEAIDRDEAFSLYTGAGARLVGDADRRGTLQPGRLADFAAYAADPMRAPIDDLPNLRPVVTCVGGRSAYDAEGVLED